jgi:lycopene cyclase domain-containing protein
MREYTLASLLALCAALGVSGSRGLLTDRSLWIGLVAFSALTVVADVILTGFGVYGYGSRYDAGILIGRMPIEDLAYALALYLVAAVAWSWGGEDGR